MNFYIVVLLRFIIEVKSMWQLPKSKEFLPEVSSLRLQKLYDTEKNAKAKIRLLSAIHRKKGKSIDAISYLLKK